MTGTSRIIDSELGVLRRALELQDSLEGIRKEARDLVARADRSGVSAPVFLREMAGMGPEEPAAEGPFLVPRMRPPVQEPPGLVSDALWVDATSSAVAVRTLVIAILGLSGESMAVRDVLGKYQEFREISSGTLANTGTALARDGVIDREKGDGWRLRPDVEPPLLADGYLWGPPERFGKTEVAWFRREVIKHLLRTLGSLQQMQIVNLLKALPWVHGPKEKDIIKMDLDALRNDGAIGRVGHSRKWILKPEAA